MEIFYKASKHTHINANTVTYNCELRDTWHQTTGNFHIYSWNVLFFSWIILFPVPFHTLHAISGYKSTRAILGNLSHLTCCSIILHILCIFCITCTLIRCSNDNYMSQKVFDTSTYFFGHLISFFSILGCVLFR